MSQSSKCFGSVVPLAIYQDQSWDQIFWDCLWNTLWDNFFSQSVTCMISAELERSHFLSWKMWNIYQDFFRDPYRDLLFWDQIYRHQYCHFFETQIFQTDTEAFFETQIFETVIETFSRPNNFETDTETFIVTKKIWDPETYTETFFETKFVETDTDTLKKMKKVSIPRSLETRCHTLFTVRAW